MASQTRNHGVKVVVWGYANSWIVKAFDSGKCVRQSTWLPEREARALAARWESEYEIDPIVRG